VERRRRETINEGISEISKIVPGCEKNKGAILHRAVQFIAQLKENESQNIEKWSLEKLLLDQAITELGSTAEKLKNELTLVTQQRDMFRELLEEANIALPAAAKELDERAKAAAADN
jgi:transcriptional regulator CBF1